MLRCCFWAVRRCRKKSNRSRRRIVRPATPPTTPPTTAGVETVEPLPPPLPAPALEVGDAAVPAPPPPPVAPPVPEAVPGVVDDKKVDCEASADAEADDNSDADAVPELDANRPDVDELFEPEGTVEEVEGFDVNADVKEPKSLALFEAGVTEMADVLLLPVVCAVKLVIDIVIDDATVILVLSAVLDELALTPAGVAMVGRPASDSGCCEPDGLGCDEGEDASGEAPGEDAK